MSSIYQPKRKELAKVKVVSTEEYSRNRSAFRLVGSVQRGYPNFVTTQGNPKTGRKTFVEDTSALTKTSKNQLVQFFSDRSNSGKKVAYLVVPKTGNRK